MSIQPDVAPVPRIALRLDEAAASLGVSTDYFERHIAHEVRFVRRGRLKLYSVTDLARFFDEHAERVLEGVTR